MRIDGQIAGHRELLDLHRRCARGGSDPKAGYGLLTSRAAKLGYDEAAALLDQTLQDEKKTDDLRGPSAEGTTHARPEAAA